MRLAGVGRAKTALRWMPNEYALQLRVSIGAEGMCNRFNGVMKSDRNAQKSRPVRTCIVQRGAALWRMKFYERVRAELGDKQNWVDSDDLAMLHHGPFPQSFYRKLHRFVHAEYRLQKMRHGSAREMLAALPRLAAECFHYVNGLLSLRPYLANK